MSDFFWMQRAPIEPAHGNFRAESHNRGVQYVQWPAAGRVMSSIGGFPVIALYDLGEPTQLAADGCRLKQHGRRAYSPEALMRWLDPHVYSDGDDGSKLVEVAEPNGAR